MTDYSGLTVAQLKDLLKTRDLPTQGLKANLVERLVQADLETSGSGAGGGAGEGKSAEPVGKVETAVKQSATPPAKAAEAADPTVNDSSKETSEKARNIPGHVSAPGSASSDITQPAPQAANPRPSLSPEEMKHIAVAHLTKKLHRAKKFGEDEAATNALQKQLARLEKFGLDLTTQLAQELGFGKGPVAAVGRQSFNPRRRPSQSKRFKGQRR
ncbi:HCL160Cp [Eremothecium sinecaudum]|uniref:HCL160Cp n=1 Tax=Eremothecium sinecaudum TaxID=45286 RepID=A0A0X8HQ96_9SACH|nr:HCL160Cp [Eremothecium sinecaudum]AMD19991.1 HCL160Cp [Eremothecium sinecaudum]